MTWGYLLVCMEAKRCSEDINRMVKSTNCCVITLLISLKDPDFKIIFLRCIKHDWTVSLSWSSKQGWELNKTPWVLTKALTITVKNYLKIIFQKSLDEYFISEMILVVGSKGFGEGDIVGERETSQVDDRWLSPGKIREILKIWMNGLFFRV